MKKESNYDITKRDALTRFLTYDTAACARRLGLSYDEDTVFVSFLSEDYALSRREARMVRIRKNERTEEGSCGAADGKMTGYREEAGFNEVMTVCDLLCHTTEPLHLSGNYMSLEGLNRIMGGSSGSLGTTFFQKTEKAFDGRCEEVKAICREMGGQPFGKGDVSFLIPVTGPVSILIRYYESDDEFPPSLTFMYDSNICRYLFYETLWYAAGAVLDRILEKLKQK